MRKQAVQLLTQLLQCNPFDASLGVNDLKQRLGEEKAKLVELMPKDDAEELPKKWGEAAKAYQQFVDSEEKDENDKVKIKPIPRTPVEHR